MSLDVKNIYTHNPLALSGVSNSLYRSGSVSFAESVSLKRAKPSAVSYNTSIVGLYVYAAQDGAQVNSVQSVTAKFRGVGDSHSHSRPGSLRQTLSHGIPLLYARTSGDIDIFTRGALSNLGLSCCRFPSCSTSESGSRMVTKRVTLERKP